MVSLHIVTAGNGICQTGVIVSENNIITGESCHLLHALLIKYELPAMLSMKTSSHQNLNITGKDKNLIKKVVLVVIITNRIITVAHYYSCLLYTSRCV